jgi:hypothetical protein
VSNTDPKASTRRNYACMGQYYTTDGPPQAVVYEDEHGPLVRTSPFSHTDGVHLCITIERWRQWNAIVEQAISNKIASRLSAVSL